MMTVKTSSVIGILMMVLVGCSGQLGALTGESLVTQDGSVLDASTDALSPNPCTAVALVAPTGGFAGQVGVAQPLSASATCPAGQTPEFQYWGKRAADANHPADPNWTILGPYVPGSSTYTPVATDVGAYCYSVAVRAVGATENFQARSGGTCGTITDGGGASSGGITISVPLFGPNNDSAISPRFLTTGINGVTVQLPSLPVGSTITQVVARVQDSEFGPTRLSATVGEQQDLSVITVGGPSEPTNGTGTFQTITVPMDHLVAPLHTYHVGVFAIGGAPCKVTSLDVTYNP